MHVCDRESFVMWASGDLLVASEGVVQACRDQDARRAEDAVLAGETVHLTVDGRVVSTVSLADGVIVERPVDSPLRP